MRRVIRALAIVAIAAASLPARAHTGSGCAPTQLGGGAIRIEAECYSSVLTDRSGGSCEPDFDSEHTKPNPDASASGGSVLFMPHSGCGVRFAAVAFGGGSLAQFRACPSGSSATMTDLVTATVAGVSVAGSITGAGGTCQTASFEIGWIPQGAFDLDLRFDVTQGSTFANVLIDWIEFRPGVPTMTVTNVAYTIAASGPRTTIAEIEVGYDAHVTYGLRAGHTTYTVGSLVVPNATVARSDVVWQEPVCRAFSGVHEHGWVIHLRYAGPDDAEGPLPPRGVALHSADGGQLVTRHGTASDTFALVFPGIGTATVTVTYQVQLVTSPCSA